MLNLKKRSPFSSAYAKLIPVLFILCLVSSPLFAEFDFGLPTDNSEVVSAFYTDTLTHLTLMNNAYRAESSGFSNSGVFMGPLADYDTFYHNSVPFYANAYWRLGDIARPEGSIYSASMGSYIALGDHFSLPLFAYVAGGTTDKWETEYDTNDYGYNGLFTGSGLVFSSLLGTIGAFGGYYHYWGDQDLKPAKQENAMFEHFKFGVIPVLNTGRIPLLRYLLSFIRNYLAFDFAEDKLYLSSYEVKGYSPRIEFMDGFFTINSIYYGYGEKQLTPALRQQAHSIGSAVTIGLFSLEAQITGEKLSETISGWYRYYEEDWGTGDLEDKLQWSFDLFAGMRFGPLMTGMILEFGGRKGGSFGFVFGLPVGGGSYQSASNLGKFLFNYGDDRGLDLAGSFRQYRRKDE